jgi:hypothetical protein
MDDKEFEEALADAPSWTQYQVAAELFKAQMKQLNLEDTLMVQLTRPETALCAWGIFVLQRLFPEMNPECMALAVKLREIGDVQGFYPDYEDGAE